MSNPLSMVPPPAALPSFVTQPPLASASATQASTAPLAAGPVPAGAPPPAAPSPGPPMQPGLLPPGPPTQPGLLPPAPPTQPSAPPPGPPMQPGLLPPGPPMQPGLLPPGPPTQPGLPPPPPMGAASGRLSAAAAGHMARPKYIPPPELATTSAVGPMPMYQPAPGPGPVPTAAALTPHSVTSAPSVGGATVDYAQTPMAAPAAEAAAQSEQEGWLGWIRETVQKSEVLSKVAERARSSMDTMITTLDPQMRDLIYSGGGLDVVVASDKEVKVSAVREAFQTVFGKATVIGVPVPGAALVPQPVGWKGARAAAAARLQALRDAGLVPPQQAVVAVEGFLEQLEPDRWYDLSLLVLDEPGQAPLSAVTQPTEVPLDWVRRMQAASPADHPQADGGLQLSVGQVAASILQVPPSAWHEVMCGLTRRELLLPAARVLAHQYRARRHQ